MNTQADDLTSLLVPRAEFAAEPSEEVSQNGGKRSFLGISLPQLLRFLGVATLVASALSFSLQSMLLLDAMKRYYVFCGFVVLLQAAGMYCAFCLKETKGSRTLFALAVAFLPVLMLQLGAFIYYAVAGVWPGLPALLVLRADLPSVLLASALSLPILFATSFFGFSVLAREHRTALSFVFLLGNAALLLPTRSAQTVAAFAAMLFGVVLLTDLRRFRKSEIMKSFEGMVVRVMLGIPPVLLLIRSAFHNNSGLFLLSSGLLMVSLFSARLNVGRAKHSVALEFAGMGSAFLSWIYFIAGLTLPSGFRLEDWLGQMSTNPWFIPIHAVPFAVIILAQPTDAEGRKALRTLAGWDLLIGALLEYWLQSGTWSALGLVMISTCSILISYVERNGRLFNFSVAGFLLGLLSSMHFVYQWASVSPWIVLMLFGMLVVVVASYVERFDSEIKVRMSEFRGRFN